MDSAPSRFISATASTASPRTRRVLSHVSGSPSVDENTTLGMVVSAPVASSSSDASDDVSAFVANPDIRR